MATHEELQELIWKVVRIKFLYREVNEENKLIKNCEKMNSK